jgi:hypothetical protein
MTYLTLLIIYQLKPLYNNHSQNHRKYEGLSSINIKDFLRQDKKLIGLVWQTTQTLHLFFFTSPKKKHSNFFTLFISHQSFFIIIQIKKPTTKQNFFTFL